jgi:hypothetical protein
MRAMAIKTKAAAAIGIMLGLAGVLYGQTPVVHWTFDNTAANSGSGGAAYDATLVNSPGYVAGQVGSHGLDLVKANSQYVSVPYVLPDQGTIALWYYVRSYYNYNSVFDNSVNKDDWEMWIYSDGRLRPRIDDGSGDVTYDLDNLGLGGAGNWYHIAYTWDKTGSAELYVNGVSRGSDPVGSWINPGTTFYVGGGNAGNTTGDGVVDDVRIYDSELSAANVLALFSPPPAGSIAWSAETTSAITINSATAAASVDTNLTETVLVWEETATAPNPGSTNDWTYHPSLGPKSAGPVTGPISSLSADTEYTWRFYGENASTNGWSGATTFVTAFSAAQAPAFTNAEATSSITIQLGWDDNAANETGYILRRSLSSGVGPYTTIDVGNTTSYSDSGLSAATTYYYELVATNSANGSATDFADCMTNATTLAASAGQTVIEINGMSQGNNVNLPGDFGSNLDASIPGATVSDGGTPQIALTWGGDWETHGSGVWDALDPANSGVDIAQMEAGTHSITFTVANGQALKLNSVDIGMATDKTATYTFTITISEVGGAVVATYTPPAMDGDGSSGVQAQTVALNFTGDPGVDYKLEFSDSPDTNGGAIDNLYFSQVAPFAVLLSGTSVASNAVIGTLVGDLSFTTNDQSGITYSLPVTATGPDSGSFQITSVTNLRTAATIAQASYAISIEAHSGGESLGTNDFTITVDPVASTYSAFIVSAEVQAGVASGGELVGVLQAEGADPSAFTFSLNSGRTDLFEIDGTGTNLAQVGGTDPGLAGAVNYIRIQAVNAAATNNLVVAVQVVDGTPSGTLFMFR